MNVETPLYSISEVSEVTGVNAVTLRAWQRRYGLLVPQRTPKGHRLYTDDDIRKIHTILAWLAKGVSIGKVKPLLVSGDVPVASNDGEKIELVDETVSLIEQGKVQQVESRIREAMKLYPFPVLEAQYLTPIDQFIARPENPLREMQLSLWNGAVLQCVVTVLNKVNSDKHPACLLLSFSVSHARTVWQHALKLADEGKYVMVLSDLTGKLTGIAALMRERKITAWYVVGDKKLTSKQLDDIDALCAAVSIPCEWVGSIKTIHQR